MARASMMVGREDEKMEEKKEEKKEDKTTEESEPMEQDIQFESIEKES